MFPTTLQLIILLAAYGPMDFTDVVRNSISNNSLTIEASNSVFGDPWVGIQKTLVVIYQYGNSKPVVAIATENSQLTIVPSEENHQPWNLSPPSGAQLSILGAAYGLADTTNEITSLIKENQLSFASNPDLKDGWYGYRKTFVMAYQYFPGKIKTVIVDQNDHVVVSLSPELRILKAAYGLKDVTDTVKRLVQNQRNVRLDVQVENGVFGDSWYGVPKTLVVVYQFGDGAPQVTFKVEHEQMSIAPFSPKLQVLEATYGLKDVTEFINQLVQKQGGASLGLQVNHDAFEEKATKDEKSLMILYQYENHAPKVALEADDQYLSISYEAPRKYSAQADKTKLQVLGAVYGLEDVTKKVQNKIAYNRLLLSPNNQVFGDSWVGIQKSLVIVYRCGQTAPKISITKETADPALNSANIRCFP